jgi:hypothetical protein
MTKGYVPWGEYKNFLKRVRPEKKPEAAVISTR